MELAPQTAAFPATGGQLRNGDTQRPEEQ